jgi:hypothetical protein
LRKQRIQAVRGFATLKSFVRASSGLSVFVLCIRAGGR